ncbi:hypothetical protein LTR56_015393 [Elasticomyces elasticus]|nr:hypothetical protein LTR22_023471 [Elasticomyces elasticus]KAK3634186.1 hypothetical protein LTR56_015393 [Elasticomyces elasticus]
MVLRLEQQYTPSSVAGTTSDDILSPSPMSTSSSPENPTSTSQRCPWQCRTIRLDPLAVDDAEALYPILSSTENKRLFPQFYGTNAEDVSHLRYTLIDHLHDPSKHGEAYTVKSMSSGSAVGWVATKYDPDKDDPAYMAIFIPNANRALVVAEILFIFGPHFFEQSDCKVVEWRTGTLSDSNGFAPGMTPVYDIQGILRRRALVQEPNAVTDLFRATRDEWPGVRTAMCAWLGLKTGPSCPLELPGSSGSTSHDVA